MNEQKKTEENIVFIGGKSVMTYAKSILIQFEDKKAKEIKIVSRGKFISKAVDSVEVARKKLLKNHPTNLEIKIDSEEFNSKEGKRVIVSTMELTLKKI
jgi:DNA-binding protein Alba